MRPGSDCQEVTVLATRWPNVILLRNREADLDLLIDAGFFAEQFDSIESMLGRLSSGAVRVDAILITHMHTDHCRSGGLRELLCRRPDELGDLPFLQDTAEDARTVTDALFPYFDKALEDIGVHSTVLWKSAPTGIVSKVNVTTLEEWKGVSLRAWSPVLVELSDLLGVRPVQMPYSEAFSATSTGIIDGVFWSPASAVSEHMVDAGAKYYDQWNIFTMTSGALIGDKPLRKLSPSAQKVVLDTFPEMVDEVWENEYWGFEGDYEEFRSQGGEVVFVDPAEIARVRALTSVVWDKALDKSGDLGLEVLNAVLAAMGRPAYK